MENLSKKEIMFIAAVMFFAFIARFFMLPFQPSPREIYADSAANFLLAGGSLFSSAMPVLDITPLISYAYEASYKVFGADLFSARVLGIIIALCSMLAFYMASRQVLKPFFASAGLVFYGILINSPVMGGQYSEGALLAQLPVLLATAFTLKPEEEYENVSFAIAGALSAIAFFCSYHSAISAAVPFCLALFNSPGKKEALQRALWFVCAAFVFFFAGIAHIVLNGVWKGFVGTVWMSLRYFQPLIFAPYAALLAAFLIYFIDKRRANEENKQR